MWQIKNSTPFAPAITLFPNEKGVDTLYAILKASFTLGQQLKIAEKQIPPTKADEYWGEPGISSLRYASDLHIGKPSTDVVLVGQAWPPNGHVAAVLDTTVAVAERQKAIHVYGNRCFKAGFFGLSISAPEPFESMPLVYERTFGGPADARNPVGLGFVKERKGSKEFETKPVPNLEDPNKPYKGLTDKGEPACYGFIAPSWTPRLQFAGTYDETWQKKRAPYLPDDFNPRYFNAAHPDLVFDRYLQGGEPVQLINVSRHGPLRFQLPRCDVRVEVTVGSNTQKVPLHCETVLFEPDENRMSMVWRGGFPCDKKTHAVSEIAFSIDALQGVH